MFKSKQACTIEKVIRRLYPKGDVGLHLPYFDSREHELLSEVCSDGFVSGGGRQSAIFSELLAKIYNVDPGNVALTSSGTSGLHMALIAEGVDADCCVVVPAVSFVATYNAVQYTGAQLIILDVSEDTLGLDPERLEEFLRKECDVVGGRCLIKRTKKVVKCAVPVFTLGVPPQIEKIRCICRAWNISVVEDQAEALGGPCTDLGSSQSAVVSFNANKIITTGGGGAVISSSIDKANFIKHIGSTAKVPHAWQYNHDCLGFNYRLSDLHSAVGIAQMERLDKILRVKKKIYIEYESAFQEVGIKFFNGPAIEQSNHWLNAVWCDEDLSMVLTHLHSCGIFARPLWGDPTSFKHLNIAFTGSIEVARKAINTVLTLPSGIVGCRIDS